MKVTKTISPQKLKESEYEERMRLRAEIAYIKAENEVIKKENKLPYFVTMRKIATAQ